MTGELLHDAIVAGLLVALGFGLEHIRIRWSQRQKRHKRKQALGRDYRPSPEVYTGRWTADHGRTQWR